MFLNQRCGVFSSSFHVTHGPTHIADLNVPSKLSLATKTFLIPALGEQTTKNTNGIFLFLRYNQAKNIARDLEKQANKVSAEAKEAAEKALQIYANLTTLPSIDTAGLEVF